MKLCPYANYRGLFPRVLIFQIQNNSSISPRQSASSLKQCPILTCGMSIRRSFCRAPHPFQTQRTVAVDVPIRRPFSTFLSSLLSFNLPAVVHPTSVLRCAGKALIPISGPLAAAARRSIFQQVRRKKRLFHSLYSLSAVSRGPKAVILRSETSPCLYPACMTYTHQCIIQQYHPLIPMVFSAEGIPLTTRHPRFGCSLCYRTLNREPDCTCLYLISIACCV